MLTIQKTFLWEGDLLNFPVQGLNLTFSYPDFTYNEVPDSNGLITRGAIDMRTIELGQDYKNGEYFLSFGSDVITGSGNNTIGFLNYFKQKLSLLQTADVDPEAITVKVNALLSSAEGEPLDAIVLKPIFFLKNLRNDSLDSIIALYSNDKLATFVEKNAFFVNSVVYEELISELPFPPEFSVAYQQPLFAISHLVDLSSGKPTLAAAVSQSDTDAILQIFNQLGFPDPQKQIDLVKSYFDRLFDFPLSTKNIKPQEVGGTFTINAPEGVVLVDADLDLYDLSLEYVSTDADGEEQQNALHFDWSDVRHTIKDNSVVFSFSKTQLIFPAKSDAELSIYVRSSDSLILWSKDYKAGNPALKTLHIEVPLLGAGAISPADRVVLNNKRLRGQLLDLTKTAVLKDAVIAIEAKKAGDKNWRVVASGTADNTGNFSLSYPYGVFVAAQAVVSLMPHNPVDVPIKVNMGDNRTISDDFLFLLLSNPLKSNPPTDSKDDCGCDEKKSSRLPDHADLIHSDEYTQDLGNGCLDLSTPNRTLREYSYQAIVRTSDPDIANYTLKQDEEGKYQLVGDNKVIKRKSISLHNPIRWQDAPEDNDTLNFYQTVSVATGHILHYKSQIKADGYSLGELLYSLPLAPGQKKQIVIFDNSHNLQGSEQQQLSVSERLASSLVNDRDISDQLGGGINENVRGNSSASTAGISAGLGVSASIGAVGGSLGVAGGYSNSHSNAEQDSGRNIAQFFSEKLRNGLLQNADSYRQQNASVITTVSEGQRYSASTEVIANHNHCHSLTMMYFEVLRHYAAYQDLVNVEECVFVPLLMTHFTMGNIFKWQDVLAQNLLPIPSNTYLPSVDGKHPLAKAFDAISRINIKYVDIDFPSGRYSEEPIRFINGQLQVNVNLPRPKTRFDRILSLPIVNTQVSHQEFDPEQQVKNILAAPFTFGLSLAGGPAMKTVVETVQVRAQIFDQFMTLDANYGSVPPAQAVRVTNFENVSVAVSPLFITDGSSNIINLAKDRFFDGNELDRRQWEAYGLLLGYTDVFKFLGAYFKGKLVSEWDTIFYNDIAPALFEKIIQNINFTVTPPVRGPVAPGAPVANAYNGFACDFSSTSRYTGGNVNMTLNVRGTSTTTREKVPEILYLSAGSAVANLSDVISFRLENFSLRYTTAHITNLLFSGYLGDDIQDGTAIYMPLTSEDQRNPRWEDRIIANKLMEHLNSHLEYYNKALWYNLDPDRRYLLLDGFNIQVFNDFGVPIGLKSLASVVKNELVTVAGNALVFPVASGFKVAKSYIVEKTETGTTEKLTLLDHYKPLTPVPPYRLSIPTRGVYAEAMMGSCNSCEKVQEHTSQDWTKFTTDTPTGINNLAPATAVNSDWKAVFKELSAPVLSLQQAPAAPAPGAGLAGLSDALTKSGTFQDITGLAKNQSNAIDTYKANTDAAVKFAEMAKSLAGQSHNTDNADKIMDNLKNARDTGAISKEDYAALVKKHLEQQIDGGDSAKKKEKATAKADEKKNEKPSITDAAVKAVDEGKDIKAKETDKKGNTKSVAIKNNKPKTDIPTPVKKFYKTIVFKALDCYGDIMGSEFHVTIRDAVSNQEVNYDEFDQGSGSLRAGFTTEAPTVQIIVSAPAQENALSPINKSIRYDSDAVIIPATQAAVNVLLKQQSQKAIIQTKDSVLTGEKVLKELSAEGSGGTSGKGTEGGGGKPGFEVNGNLALKIAGKYSKEISSTTGHDEGKTFEVIAPIDHYDISVK